jgi:hypothetical protein
MEGGSAPSDSRVTEQFPETLDKAIEGGVYTNEQLYNCDETGLSSILLPNKSLDLENALSKVGTKRKRERVVLLLCSCNAGRQAETSLCWQI